MSSSQVKDLGSLTSNEVRACPVPFFKRLLQEAPVYRDPATGHFIVTRYADMVAVCDNPDVFRNQADVMIGRANSPVAAEVQRRFAEHGFPEMHTLSTADRPEHTRYRRLVDKVFTPSFVKSLEPKIRQISDELIDNFVDRGHVNLVDEFAILLPMYMIVDQLGVSRDDWRKIKRWSDITAERSDPVLSAERELSITDQTIEMQNYLHGYIERYRANPQHNLLSDIANVEENGDKLSDAEAVSVSFQLMVGGNETTTTAILSMINEAVARPGLCERMRADHSLIPLFVEEVLRTHSPVPVLFRIAGEDTQVGGIAIPKGSLVQLAFLGANYDPERWAEPDAFDIHRKGLRNHFTFGRGLHFCIGHLLAKAELRIALERLLTRLPNMRLSASHPAPEYTPHAFAHILDSMHLDFDPPAKRQSA